MASPTLGFYLDGTLRLLHEDRGIFYDRTDDPTELFAYINEARRQVAFDAKLFRSIQSFTINADTTIYSVPSLTGFVTSFSIFRIYVTSGGRTWPLSQLSYTDLMEQFLGLTQKQEPIAYAKINQTQFRIGPIPPTNYAAELDLVNLPDDLANEDDADSIFFPFADCVKFYAAYLAYPKDKAYTESNDMIQRYEYTMAKNLGDAVEFIAARKFYQEYRTG